MAPRHRKARALSIPRSARSTALRRRTKLAAVAIAGKGYWITGTGMIVAVYAVSIFVVERLFLIVKPKLLTLVWFRWSWTRFVALRDRVLRWLTCRTTIPQARADR